MIEVGSGNSTIWFSNKVRKLTSFESELSWINEIREKFNYVGEIIHHKPDYVFTAGDLDANIVLIDGHDRIGILETITRGIHDGRLSPELIIIDNSHWFPLAIFSALEIIDYIKIDFVGQSSPSWGDSLTSVLISRNVSLQIFTKKNLFAWDSISKRRLSEANYDRGITL
jgi:hypothetical protein